jgi:hypothetical protein
VVAVVVVVAGGGGVVVVVSPAPELWDERLLQAPEPQRPVELEVVG